MATQRRKKTSRRGASRGKKSAAPAGLWFLAGLLLGLAISLLLYTQGFLPQRPSDKPVASPSQAATGEEIVDESESIAGESTDRRFDFFTVLPEMEVVVPDQELSRDAGPEAAPIEGGGSDSYILQVGSFRSAADAEQMKARLALLGNVATIQVVTVNGATWHRVRIGPVQGPRRADEVRRVLQDNGIETLVMKASG
jgi:cell division protein FtsN